MIFGPFRVLRDDIEQWCSVFECLLVVYGLKIKKDFTVFDSFCKILLFSIFKHIASLLKSVDCYLIWISRRQRKRIGTLSNIHNIFCLKLYFAFSLLSLPISFSSTVQFKLIYHCTLIYSLLVFVKTVSSKCLHKPTTNGSQTYLLVLQILLLQV